MAKRRKTETALTLPVPAPEPDWPPETPTANVTPDEVLPQVSFAEAWRQDASLRALLTLSGDIRSGLRPSQIKDAERAKKRYGV